MSSLPFTPPRQTSSRNALIFDDDIDTSSPFPVRDERPTSPSPSTSDFSLIGADEAELANARDLDYNNSFWSYNTGTPYRGGPFGSFGRRVIYSTPTLNLLSSYNGASDDYGSGGQAAAGSGSGSGAGTALKSLFPRLWDVLVSSPTRNILSTSRPSMSADNSPTSNRQRNSSYMGHAGSNHMHTHTHPYTPPTGSRLTKSKNHREARPCNCASRSYNNDGYPGHNDAACGVESSPVAALLPDLVNLDIASPSSSPTENIRHSTHSLSSQYSYININFSDLPPLDGEEGELVDIDDEACFVPPDQFGPYGAYGTWNGNHGGLWRQGGKGSFSRARVVTGIDILSMLPTEIALVVMEMLVVATSASTPPSLSQTQDEPQSRGGNDANRKSAYRGSRFLNLETPFISSCNYTPEQALQDLLTCTLVSKRWKGLAMDNSVWKAAYEGRWGDGVEGGGITKEKDVLERYLKRQATKKKRPESWMSFLDDPSEQWVIPHDEAESSSSSAPRSSEPSLGYLVLYKERLELDRRWAGSAFEKRVIYHRKAINPLCLPSEMRPKLRRNHQPANVFTPIPMRRGGTVYIPYRYSDDSDDNEPEPQPTLAPEDDPFLKINELLKQPSKPIARPKEWEEMTREEQLERLRKFEEMKKKYGFTFNSRYTLADVGSTTGVYANSTNSTYAETTASYDVVSNSDATTSWEVTSPVAQAADTARSGSRSRPGSVARLTGRHRGQRSSLPFSRSRSRTGTEDGSSSSSSDSGSGSRSGSAFSSASASTVHGSSRNLVYTGPGNSIGYAHIVSEAKRAAAGGSRGRPLDPEERRRLKEKEVAKLLRGDISIEREEWEKWEPKIMRISGHKDSVYCIELPTLSEAFQSTINEHNFDPPIPLRSAEMNKLFVTGSRDRTIKMWSSKTGRCLGTFGVRKDGAVGEGLVLSGGPPGVRKRVEKQTDTKGTRGEELDEDDRKGHKGSVLCLKFVWERFGLDKDEYWSDGEQHLRRKDVKGKGKGKAKAKDDEVEEVKRIGRRGVMFSGSSDSTVCVWDVWEEVKVKVGERNTEGEGSDEYEEDDPEDVAYRQYEMRARVRKVLRGHTGGVLDIRVDDKWIVSCSKDTTIRVWNRNTLEMHRIMRGHEGPVNAVGMEEGRVVSASGDGKMILWDVESGERLRTFEGHDRGLACIEYKDGLIISGSNDCKIKMWSAKTGECLCTLDGHDALVRALAYDPLSGRLVSASYDKAVRVWDVKDVKDGRSARSGSEGRLLREFRTAHTSQIFDVRFDLGRIVSTSHDQNIVVADFESKLDSAELFV